MLEIIHFSPDRPKVTDCNLCRKLDQLLEYHRHHHPRYLVGGVVGVRYGRYCEQLVLYFQTTTAEYFGCGIDAVTCADAWGNGNPGFDAMELGDKAYKTMSPSGRLAKTDPDDYIFHF